MASRSLYPTLHPGRASNYSSHGGARIEGLVLHGARVTLRRATENDLHDLAAVLRSPGVKEWWGAPPANLDELRRGLLADDGTVVMVVVVEERCAGLVQFHEETDPEYRSAGIDIALADAYQGRGLGTDTISTVARYLFEVRGHHRLTIDPAAANQRAIACYRRVGFRPVGVMRQYERGADGTWHDGLLLDLLREEFVPYVPKHQTPGKP